MSESGEQKIKRPANNYFRAGFGRGAKYVFFNDLNLEEVEAAWLKAGSIRAGVWKMPGHAGPWQTEAVVIAGESLWMGRRQLGPVVS